MVNCSVLIPAYNAENYLRRALDSVINQTYKDFEIIIIDDGSTDSTPQICDEYGEKYHFIHVYHQKNIGASKTRELLITKATGNYIFWLDADDYYDATLLKKAVKAFEKEAADIVVWGWTELKPTGSKQENPIKRIGTARWKELMCWGLCAGIPLYSSRKKFWEGLEKFPDDVKITDDVWLTSQIASKAERIISLDENLYVYDRRNINLIPILMTQKDCIEMLLLSTVF